MEFRKSRPVSLRSNPLYNETWLHNLLAEDPSVLGLPGDLVVKQVERRQPHAGRLDMLLSDPETLTRYEVEIQLGATDESHIIRTIEYWDIEKSRYPQYEHVAVLVAEDITSRFLNVVSLFNRAIPLIAIQLQALDVDGVLTLSATTVFDLVRLGTDEDDEPGQTVDRDYWTKRGSQSVVLADELLAMANEIAPGLALKYNRHYIGLAREGVAENFLTFRPRRGYLVTEFRIPRRDDVSDLIEESGVDTLPYQKRWGKYRLQLTRADVHAQKELLVRLIRLAADSTETPEDVDLSSI